MINKRGQTTMFLIIGLLLIVVLIISLIVVGITSGYLNSLLDQNITIGSENLADLNSQTIGQFNLMVVNNADFWGLAIIFGMIIGLFLSSYFLRNTKPRIGVLVDIGFVFTAFIFSLYLRFIYSEVVVALSSAGQTFATTSLTKTNFFILNLPIFVTIIGVIMMVLFHSGIPPKQDELNVVPQVVT